MIWYLSIISREDVVDGFHTSRLLAIQSLQKTSCAHKNFQLLGRARPLTLGFLRLGSNVFNGLIRHTICHIGREDSWKPVQETFFYGKRANIVDELFSRCLYMRQ